MMNDINVNIEVQVNQTEDIEKVKQAVKNIFGLSRHLMSNPKHGDNC